MGLPSLKLTAKAPENWLEDDPASFWDTIFSGAFAVSFREVIKLSPFANTYSLTYC